MMVGVFWGGFLVALFFAGDAFSFFWGYDEENMYRRLVRRLFRRLW